MLQLGNSSLSLSIIFNDFQWSWESCSNFLNTWLIYGNVLSLLQKPSPGVTFDLPSIDSTLPVPDTTSLTTGLPAPQPSSTEAGVHTVHVKTKSYLSHSCFLLIIGGLDLGLRLYLSLPSCVFKLYIKN